MALDQNINRLKFVRTKTAGKAPSATDITEGELAMNLADKTLYGNNNGSVFRFVDPDKVLTYQTYSSLNSSINGTVAFNTYSGKGALVINLPKDKFPATNQVGFPNTMVKFRVHGFNLSNNSAWNLICSGYTYVPTTSSIYWHSPTAAYYGGFIPPFSNNGDLTNTVKFVTRSDCFAVVIGQPNSTWSNSQVQVDDLSVYYSNSNSGWDTGWTIEYITDQTAYDSLINQSSTSTPPIYGANRSKTADEANKWSTSTTLRFGGGNGSLGDVAGSIAFDGSETVKDVTLTVRSASTAQTGIVQLYDGQDSTSTTMALTANQGRVLTGAINTKVDKNNPTSSGTLSHTGKANISDTLNVAGNVIDIGNGTVNYQANLDFHSGSTPTIDYDTRIASTGGTTANAQGSLSYIANGGHTFTGAILGSQIAGTNVGGHTLNILGFNNDTVRGLNLYKTDNTPSGVGQPSYGLYFAHATLPTEPTGQYKTYTNGQFNTYFISATGSITEKRAWIFQRKVGTTVTNIGAIDILGNASFDGNIQTTSDNTMINVGNNSDLALVKKAGGNGFIGVGTNTSFTVKKSNASTVDPSNTFTDLFAITGAGNVITTGEVTAPNGFKGDIITQVMGAPYKILPSDLAKKATRIDFTSQGGMNNAPDARYGDFIGFNTWSDVSGGTHNALFLTKTGEKRILHYRASFGATAWGTPDTVAYLSDITGGNAASATKLQTPRYIFGQSFDGTANVTGAASVTRVDVENTPYAALRLVPNTGTKGTVFESAGEYPYIAIRDRNTMNVPNIALFSFPTLTGNHTIAMTSSNVASATKLETARAINGVSFDGTSDITVVDSTKLPLTGGTITGNLSVTGSITITGAGNVSTGVINGPSTPLSVLTGSAARGVNMGQLLVSNAYSDASKVPTNGAYIKGGLVVDGGITGSNLSLAGNAATASSLNLARTISITGDATWSTSFKGDANVSGVLTLANTGVVAGTHKAVTVDAKGRATAGVPYTVGLVTSTSNTGTTNAATNNSNTFLNVVETLGGTATSVGSSQKIQGSGGVTVSSDTSGNITINAPTNAPTATALQTARSFSITGGATAAAVSFNGTQNVALNVTSIDGTKVTGKVPSAIAADTATTADTSIRTQTVDINNGPGKKLVSAWTGATFGNYSRNFVYVNANTLRVLIDNGINCVSDIGTKVKVGNLIHLTTNNFASFTTATITSVTFDVGSQGLLLEVNIPNHGVPSGGQTSYYLLAITYYANGCSYIGTVATETKSDTNSGYSHLLRLTSSINNPIVEINGSARSTWYSNVLGYSYLDPAQPSGLSAAMATPNICNFITSDTDSPTFISLGYVSLQMWDIV